MRSSSDDDESCTMRFGSSRSHAMRLRWTMRISGAKHCAFDGQGFVTDSMLNAAATESPARNMAIPPSHTRPAGFSAVNNKYRIVPRWYATQIRTTDARKTRLRARASNR